MGSTFSKKNTKCECRQLNCQKCFANNKIGNNKINENNNKINENNNKINENNNNENETILVSKPIKIKK